METVCYCFLVPGAVFACVTALRWLGMAWRRCLGISLAAGVVSGLLIFLPVDVRQAHLLCFLFLMVFLPVMLAGPGGSVSDTAAAVSIACGCYGMLQLTAGTVVRLEIVSPFFRFMLILLLTAVSWYFCFVLWGKAFGEERRDVLREEAPGFYLYLVVYGVTCALPAVMDCYSLPVLLLEWFGFFGGLALLNLLILHRREKEAIESEKQYRGEMQAYMSVIRSQRHDYNFHVQTLHGLLRQKDYKACERYLEELMKDSVAVNRLLPLADAAVSALILSFQSRARQSGISMEIAIENDLSRIATNVYETNKVIGNLLQNALDATRELSDKSYGIHLSIIKRGEFCLISVSNRIEGEDPMEAYQVGHSRKKGHEGIGIASIRALVSGYGGTVYSRIEEDVIYFIAKIPLRIIKEAP